MSEHFRMYFLRRDFIAMINKKIIFLLHLPWFCKKIRGWIGCSSKIGVTKVRLYPPEYTPTIHKRNFYAQQIFAVLFDENFWMQRGRNKKQMLSSMNKNFPLPSFWVIFIENKLFYIKKNTTSQRKFHKMKAINFFGIIYVKGARAVLSTATDAIRVVNIRKIFNSLYENTGNISLIT